MHSSIWKHTILSLRAGECQFPWREEDLLLDGEEATRLVFRARDQERCIEMGQKGREAAAEQFLACKAGLTSRKSTEDTRSVSKRRETDA